MFGSLWTRTIGLWAACFLLATAAVSGAEDWTQLKYDGRHSGNVPERSVAGPLGLI